MHSLQSQIAVYAARHRVRIFISVFLSCKPALGGATRSYCDYGTCSYDDGCVFYLQCKMQLSQQDSNHAENINIYSYNKSKQDALFRKNLFAKVLYMFRTCPLSIIRSISTLYTCNGYLSCQFCWRLPADANRTSSVYSVYSVDILLMMDSGPVRNVQSNFSNKTEKQCISLAFIIRIHHDAARSSECQINIYVQVLSLKTNINRDRCGRNVLLPIS